MAWLQKMSKRLKEVCEIFFKFPKNHREFFAQIVFSHVSGLYYYGGIL